MANRGVGLSIFNRDRNSTVNYIISKLPTNVGLSVRRVRHRVTHHTPNESGASATHGRTSLPHVLDNILGNAAANTPLTVVVRGAGAHDNSCRGIRLIPHPNRDSCPTFIGCNKFGSVENNKRFDNELATPVIFTNTVTGRVLEARNVRVNSRVSRVNGIRSSRVGHISVSPGALRTLAHRFFPILEGRTRRRVHSFVRGTHLSNSSTNNIVRYTMAKVPINLNSGVFSAIRDGLSTTLFTVPTIGNIRFKTNFNFTRVLNDRTGSPCRVGGNEITFGSGGGNNILNNVDDNTPLIFSIIIGPAPSVSGRRSDISLSAVRGRGLIVGNERSPYVIPHTIPITRTATTLIILSLVVRSNVGKWLLW